MTQDGQQVEPAKRASARIIEGRLRVDSGTKECEAGQKRVAQLGGFTGWLLAKLNGKSRSLPQLAILERISLAPRQSLTLIEASGQRLLVATSADGTPAFYPVTARGRQMADRGRWNHNASRPGRISW